MSILGCQFSLVLTKRLKERTAACVCEWVRSFILSFIRFPDAVPQPFNLSTHLCCGKVLLRYGSRWTTDINSESWLHPLASGSHSWPLTDSHTCDTWMRVGACLWKHMWAPVCWGASFVPCKSPQSRRLPFSTADNLRPISHCQIHDSEHHSART